MRHHSIPCWSILLLASFAGGCKHEADISSLDLELYELAQSTNGHVWYRANDDLLDRTGGSGHGEPLLRTRYNAIAATVLDSSGRVEPDTLFPSGSLIVKELWESGSTLGTYAVMLKRPGDPSADAGGWVWGYIRASGEVRVSALEQGAACRNCHTQAGHIDATLMNLAFP
ncbi:MAG: cytochrome P460 family protein [Flavobacteriales bacterium]|nr:cytochrome P460 family protein [Flavobacteriales bacterium]